MKRLLCSLVALVLFLGIAGQAKAQFNYTELDVPGSTDTVARGINPSGQIIGTYYDVTNQIHGYRLDQGVYTTLDPSGSILTVPYGITPSGQIVGDYVDAAYNQHAFLVDKGGYTTFDVTGLGSEVPLVTGITPSGQLMGSYQGPDQIHRFLLDQG